MALAADAPAHTRALRLASDIASGRHALSNAIAPALVAFDVALCALIIWKIPYTEIDWTTYMQQVALYLSGERDYTKLTGSTGPLVYPAAHVYLYAGLYHVTDQGRDIAFAQLIFAVLYLTTLLLVMACYRMAKVPPYVLPLLVLSKRLHSIFILRCFNDGPATLLLWLAIFLLQRRHFALGAMVYSLGLGIKMSLILVLPALGVVLLQARGFAGALRVASLIAQTQALLGLPFLAEHPASYLSRAFEFSRQFMFKWTVNWRFMGEEAFLSREFAATLLVMHVSVLLAFIAQRWLRPSGMSLSAVITPMLAFRSPFTEAEERRIAVAVTPQYILTSVLTANVVGLLFARSLHYQFYAYLAWSTPFLLWRAGVHPVIQYGLWALQEWAWNVYPSTSASSGVAVGVMALTVALVWSGTRSGQEPHVQAATEPQSRSAKA